MDHPSTATAIIFLGPRILAPHMSFDSFSPAAHHTHTYTHAQPMDGPALMAHKVNSLHLCPVLP